MRRGLAAGLLALLGTALSACNRSSEVRYRMTVEVDDNGTTRAGSSVWRFRMTRGLLGSYQGRFRGEAVAVDLLGRGTLFALVTGRTRKGGPSSNSDMAMLPERLFGDIGRASRQQPPLNRDRVSDVDHIGRQIGATAAIDCAHRQRHWSNCPYMVTYRDIRDPKSVEPVDPLDLAASFGAGVTLKRVAVEITRDAVTTGIDEHMPPFGEKTGFGIWYRSLPAGDPRGIGPEAFKWDF